MSTWASDEALENLRQKLLAPRASSSTDGLSHWDEESNSWLVVRSCASPSPSEPHRYTADLSMGSRMYVKLMWCPGHLEFHSIDDVEEYLS